MAGVVYDENYGHNVMRLQNTAGYPEPRVETLTEASYGTWTVRFNLGVVNSNHTIFDYSFVHDRNNYYKVSFDTENSPYTVSLYYNNTLLDSEEFSPGTTIHILEINRDWNRFLSVSIDGVLYLESKDYRINESVKTQFYLDSVYSTFARGAQVDYIQFDQLV